MIQPVLGVIPYLNLINIEKFVLHCHAHRLEVETCWHEPVAVHVNERKCRT